MGASSGHTMVALFPCALLHPFDAQPIFLPAPGQGWLARPPGTPGAQGR